MRLIVARVDPAPTGITPSQVEEALTRLPTVEHVYVREQDDGWMVGTFVMDDGSPTTDGHADTPVRETLAATLAGLGSRIELHSEFLDEAPGGLLP